MSLAIEYRAIDDLIPFVNNARTHNDEQVAQIAASIKEFGWTNPILVDDGRGVIAGHGRLMAARKLGYENVPTIELEGLSDAQKRAYILADNKLAENAGWDNDLLKIELNGLDDEGFDLSLIGFSQIDLNNLLNDPAEGLTDPDEVPDAPEHPVTREGDVWVLGNHRLMCGDSTSTTALQSLLGDLQADLVFTDPPWNVNYGANTGGMPWKQRSILNDHKSDSEWLEFCQGFSASLFAATKPGAPIYLVMSAQEWPVVDSTLREAGFHWSSTIMWIKDTLVLSRKDYHTQYEPIWYGWNDKAGRRVKVQDRKQSDVWKINRPKRSELHPTTKPVELVERAIDNSSNAKDLVLDLFGGSGSTLIAAEKTGRAGMLCELDPKYCDVIVQRWQDFTGRQAVLEESGEFFPTIKRDAA